MKLNLRIEAWPLAAPFRITNYVFDTADVLVVALSEGGVTGLGEGAGVYYHGETPQALAAQLEAVRGEIEAGIDRDGLRRLLPAGGARNALDAALWDLQAKRTGEPVWQAAGVGSPRPLITTFTVGAAEPAQMAQAARAYGSAKAIKLKLTADDPEGCVRAVREARPDAWLAVDANQGLTRESLERILPALAEARIAFVEQPLAVGREAELDGLVSPVPLAADESLQTLADLPGLVGRFQIANIKLDKAGGLTEGLAMAREARRLGLTPMVGCMSGTSLAIAPGFVLAQICDFVDLDGPTFLSRDRPNAATYENGEIWCPEAVWGAGAMHLEETR